MNISANYDSKYVQRTASNSMPSFTSRNKILRELSDIGMLARREIPVCSATKLERKSEYRVVHQLLKYLDNIISDVRGFVRFGPPDKALIRTMDCMKRYGVGNCGELADAAYVACKMNGFKNTKLMSLGKYNIKTHEIEPLDHSIVGINFSEKSRVPAKKTNLHVYLHDNEGIIMDNWYGFVDYAKNATTQYKIDKVWGAALKPDERFCYIDYSHLINLKDKDMLYFEHTYPNLMKSGKISLKDKIKWLFTDKKEYKFEPLRRSVKEAHRRNAKLKNSMSQSEFSELIRREVQESEKASGKIQ